MAGDVIELIDEDFDGHVEGVFGVSLGGFLMREVALQRPDIADNFIMLISAYKVNDTAHEFDRTYAQHFADGEYRQALIHVAGEMFDSELQNRFAQVAMFFTGEKMGREMEEQTSTTYSEDILIEVEAEIAFNFKDTLDDLEVPVLVVGIDNDFWFSKELYEETASLIPQSQFVMLEGRGHAELMDEEVYTIIEEYLHRNK